MAVRCFCRRASPEGPPDHAQPRSSCLLHLEQVLLRLPGVRRASVVVREEHGFRGWNGFKRFD